MGKLIIAVLAWVTIIQAMAAEKDIRKLHSPYIEDDTLYIYGAIDSHIYDFMAYEREALKEVKQVSVNSLGGSSQWGLQIGHLIQSLGKDTIIEQGHFCASACLYIFGAGVNRLAHEKTWFGLHGARLGAGFIIELSRSCNINQGLVDTSDPECEKIIEKWHKLAKKTTNQGFVLLASAGVEEALATDYFSLPDQEHWAEQGNVLRKPDWRMSIDEAVTYNLVTQVIGDPATD